MSALQIVQFRVLHIRTPHIMVNDENTYTHNRVDRLLWRTSQTGSERKKAPFQVTILFNFFLNVVVIVVPDA